MGGKLAAKLGFESKPRATAFQLRRALKFYRFTAIVTGVLLLLLCVEMYLKYGLGVEVYAGSEEGPLALLPLSKGPYGDEVAHTGLNLSTLTLIVHGWFYVVYLWSDFNLWSRMRWGFPVFILIALGGVIPFLSFIVEHYVHRRGMRLVAASEAK